MARLSASATRPREGPLAFLIADTFSEGLPRLSTDEQNAIKITAFDPQMNPASPGLNFHRLEHTRDKIFWSVRVNADIRIIVRRKRPAVVDAAIAHWEGMRGD